MDNFKSFFAHNFTLTNGEVREATGRKTVATPQNIYTKYLNACTMMGQEPEVGVQQITDYINSLKQEMTNRSNEGIFIDNTEFIPIKSELFKHNMKWNNVDEGLFKYFKFAVNDADGTLVMLISTNGRRMYPVYLGSSTKDTDLTIAAMCKSIPIEESYGTGATNLYDFIQIAFEKKLAKATDEFNRVHSSSRWVEWCSSNLPTSMLTNSTLMVSVLTRTVGRGDNAYEVKTATSCYFADGTATIDPIKFIATNMRVIAAQEGHTIPMPKVFSNSLDVPALNYLDIENICQDGECPTWNFYMKRFSEDDAAVFKAFIWSVLDASNNGRQLLYIYDRQGFSGKSVVTNVLNQFLGSNLVAALQKDSLNNQFSMAKIWNKRLVVIDDNKNPNLIKGGKMHMITGGGLAEIEQKGRNSFSSRLQCKVIANGNTAIEIDTSADHEVTRTIVIKTEMKDEYLKEFCKVDDNGNLCRYKDGRPIFIGSSTFESYLLNEFPIFLNQCKAEYERLCPTHSSIVLPDSTYDNVINSGSIEEDCYDEIAVNGFDIGAEFSCKPTELYKQFRAMTDHTAYRDILTYDHFTDHIIKKYKFIKSSRPHRGPREIVGIRPKETPGDKLLSAASPIPKQDSNQIEPMEDAVLF